MMMDPNAIDNRLRGLRGMLETPEMLAGGGTKAGGGTIPVPGYNPRDMDNQISVRNIDDQGNITGQTGLGRMVAKYGNIKDLDSFSPELQAAIQGYQSRPEGGGIFGNQGIGVGALGPTVTASAMGETRPALYDPRQRAIDEGYQPGSGFMYEGKFYESGNPGRVSMDMAPLDSLFANNPAAREAFKESGSKLVMNSNPNPQAGQLPQGIGTQGPGQPGGILGKLGPDPSAIFANQAKIPYNATVSPDPFSDYNVANAYKQSDFYDDSMQSQGYLDFLQNSRDNFMRSDMQMNMKSDAYNDARSKIFNAYDTFNPITNQDEISAHYAANPGVLGGPMNVRKYDDGFFLNTGKPTITNGGFDMKMPDSFVKPDFVTADYDHLKNIGEPSTLPALPDFGEPVTEMPTPATGGMNSDFANQLLSGIGNLFDKYLSSPSMKQNNLGMGSTNQITPPTPPEQMMTADTQSSMPNSLGSLGSQGMFTPGRGY